MLLHLFLLEPRIQAQSYTQKPRVPSPRYSSAFRRSLRAALCSSAASLRVLMSSSQFFHIKKRCLILLDPLAHNTWCTSLSSSSSSFIFFRVIFSWSQSDIVYCCSCCSCFSLLPAPCCLSLR